MVKEKKVVSKLVLGEVFELAKYIPGVTQKEALALAEQKGLRLITNQEADFILRDDDLRQKYYDFWPFWTSTKVEMNGTHCKITEPDERTVEKEIPASNGWYLQDEFGLPFGEPSDGSNPAVRYLWRRDEYSGLVARGYYDFDYVVRFVDADDCDFLSRLGVLAVKKN